MSAERDPLLDAIRAAGEVPPPPDRDGAFARAMHAIEPARAHSRIRRGMIALLAAALLAVPATVFAARTTHPAKPHTPPPAETADPASIRQTEKPDAGPTPRASAGDDRHGDDEGTTGSVDNDPPNSGEGSTVSGDDGGDDHGSPSPTPTPTDSDGSSSDGGSAGSSDGGTSGSD